MSEHVASKLKLFRQVLGWTQEHLAEAAGLSSRTVPMLGRLITWRACQRSRRTRSLSSRSCCAIMETCGPIWNRRTGVKL